MRRLTLAVAFVLASQSGAVSGGQTFRSAVRSVAVHVTALDAMGRRINTLKQEDFQILEDGVATEITSFSTDPQPITAAVMLDMSLSMTSRFVRTRHSVLSFIQALQPQDRARIGSFGMEIAVGANLTSDRRELARVLLEEMWPGGGTPLWQALNAAMTSLADEGGRRVVLVLTDGVANASALLSGSGVTEEDVERRAVAEGFMLYAIGFQGAGLDRGLRHVAAASGGTHVEVPDAAALAQVFSNVAEELRHQYLLAFTPRALDGKAHAIQVRVRQPALTLRFRNRYVAERMQ